MKKMLAALMLLGFTVGFVGCEKQDTTPAPAPTEVPADTPAEPTDATEPTEAPVEPAPTEPTEAPAEPAPTE